MPLGNWRFDSYNNPAFYRSRLLAAKRVYDIGKFVVVQKLAKHNKQRSLATTTKKPCHLLAAIAPAQQLPYKKTPFFFAF